MTKRYESLAEAAKDLVAQVVEHLNASGYEASSEFRPDHRFGHYSFTIDGEELSSWLVDFNEKRDRFGSWQSRPNGQYYCTIGSYGDKRMFNCKKSTGWDVPAVAEALVAQVRKQRARRQKDQQRTDNNSAIKTLEAEFGSYPYPVSMYPTESSERPVNLKLETSLTEAQARELLTKLVELGVVKKPVS